LKIVPDLLNMRFKFMLNEKSRSVPMLCPLPIRQNPKTSQKYTLESCCMMVSNRLFSCSPIL
jgi:hypothetical protein